MVIGVVLVLALILFLAVIASRKEESRMDTNDIERIISFISSMESYRKFVENESFDRFCKTTVGFKRQKLAESISIQSIEKKLHVLQQIHEARDNELSLHLHHYYVHAKKFIELYDALFKEVEIFNKECLHKGLRPISVRNWEVIVAQKDED